MAQRIQGSCPICKFRVVQVTGTNIQHMRCLQCGWQIAVETWNAMSHAERQQMVRDAHKDPRYARFKDPGILDKIPLPTKCTNCGHSAFMSKEQKFCGECGWRLRL
jgi:ribosomal protein L37E